MSKTWPEVTVVQQENRHELILNGQIISQRIAKDGIDKNLFKLSGLNFLNISDTSLDILPDEISNLSNLQSLMLHSNKLTTIPAAINKLTKLKLLDVSRNELNDVRADFNEMTSLVTLNLSVNKLESFPGLNDKSKLIVLDLSHNNLDEFPDVCHATHLTELRFNSNKIPEIPSGIGGLTGLKTIDFSDNNITVIPAELSDINKLKEVNLKGNPVTDRRLLKLIDQCRPKQVLDYVRQHSVRKGGETVSSKKNARKTRAGHNRKESQGDENIPEDNDDNYKYKIIVPKDEESSSPKLPVIRETEFIKAVRQYILCCVVTGLSFTEESFRKFIQMQTRLHDTVCEKRTASTIATHDLKKVLNDESDELFYDAKVPSELILKPLGSNAECSGAQLYAKLRAEAEQLRKEKKRNVYSGIHRYLYLLEGKPVYPCLVNAQNQVISFPPITNSDVTKMSYESSEMLIEATSSTSQDSCRRAIEQLLLEILNMGCTETANVLTVHRVRITDKQGNLRAVFPSRADLKYDSAQGIKIIRE